jgi:signal transduction histidine kinase/CheY-like chemotaxis protein
VSEEGRWPDDLRAALGRVTRRLDDLAQGLARIDASDATPTALPGEPLDEATRVRLRELESLLALGPPLSSEEIRLLAVDRVVHNAGADCAALFNPVPGGLLEAGTRRGMPAGALRVGLSESIVGRAFVHREVIRAAPGHEASDRLVRELGLTHALAVPLQAPGGPILGVLFAGRRRAVAFGHQELETVVLVAERLAQPRTEERDETGSAVTAELLALDLDRAASAVVEASAGRLGATHVALLVPEGERLRLVAARGLAEDAAPPDPGAPPLAGAIGGARTWVAARDGDDRDLSRFLGAPAQMVAPLAVGEQVVGVLVAGGLAPLAPAAIRGFLPVAARALQNARIHGETVAALAARDAGGRPPDVASPQPVRDFGNLLAVILARIGLARERVTDPGVGVDLRVAEEAAWRAAEAVRGVLGLAPGGRGTPVAPLELTTLVREAVDAACRRWAAREHAAPPVTLDLAPVPPIRGRAADLHAALDHLLENAAEAVSPGGEITVRTRWDGDRTVALTVEDSGAGMEESLRARALDPFFSTKGPGRLGLGLPVAHAIVTQHLGALALSSTPGLGTTAHLSFPTAASAGHAVPSGAEPAPRTARVLVVDGEPAVREALAAVLGRDGHVVVQAADGPQAIAATEREPPDVVFTSLTVPGSSGLELAATVKRLRPGTPVVLLTAWPGRLDEAVVRQSGVDRVVDKPAGTAEVLAALEAALAMRRTLRP